jgi:hypothetical protein
MTVDRLNYRIEKCVRTPASDCSVKCYCYIVRNVDTNHNIERKRCEPGRSGRVVGVNWAARRRM